MEKSATVQDIQEETSNLLTGSEYWERAITVEPPHCGLAQLFPAGGWHHSIEWVEEGLDNDAELVRTEVKGQSQQLQNVTSISRKNKETKARSSVEGYNPELPVLKRAGLDVVVELLRVVEVMVSNGSPCSRQLFLARAVRERQQLLIVVIIWLADSTPHRSEPT